MPLNDFVRPDAALVAQHREEATRQRIREGRSFEQLLEEFGRI